jgi:hypothetical protein
VHLLKNLRSSDLALGQATETIGTWEPQCATTLPASREEHCNSAPLTAIDIGTFHTDPPQPTRRSTCHSPLADYSSHVCTAVCGSSIRTGDCVQSPAMRSSLERDAETWSWAPKSLSPNKCCISSPIMLVYQLCISPGNTQRLRIFWDPIVMCRRQGVTRHTIAHALVQRMPLSSSEKASALEV